MSLNDVCQLAGVSVGNANTCMKHACVHVCDAFFIFIITAPRVNGRHLIFVSALILSASKSLNFPWKCSLTTRIDLFSHLLTEKWGFLSLIGDFAARANILVCCHAHVVHSRHLYLRIHAAAKNLSDTHTSSTWGWRVCQVPITTAAAQINVSSPIYVA